MIKLEAAITNPVTNAAMPQYSKTSLTTSAMTASNSARSCRNGDRKVLES
jgi:hypothetical protein